MTEHIEEDEFVNEDEIEIYDGEPDFDRPQGLEEGVQDDEGLGGLAEQDHSPGINDWRQTLKWYRENQTTRDIGFSPNGMCLKVCRVARGIPAMFATAKLAQDSTPSEYRVHKVEDLRAGMVGYFDEARDSNRFGHVATMIGRVRGYDMDDLAGTLWETNDVKSGELVVVRGSYFERYWNDPFKFGATWLNGKDLDWAGSNKKSRVEKFNDGGPVYNLNLLAKAHKAGRPKPGEILRRIEDAIRRLPDNRGINHVTEFKDEWRETRKIDMRHLDKAVANGRVGLVKKVRDEIRRLIDALPDE